MTVDTLRTDAVGFIGGGDATPTIDALARTGFAFPTAVAPVPLTLPSHASILTGLLPRRHGVRDNGQEVPDHASNLAVRLRDAGWATAAFVSGYPLESRFGLDRGFDHYDDAFDVGDEGRRERSARGTTDAALAWLASAPKPWFVWVHYYDPHDPYEPPRSFWRPGPRGAYDGEVAFTDFELGRLLAGLPEATLTVLAGDHGESLGEHGEQGHALFLYDVTVRVPLVFHWPGVVRPGSSREAARLVDVTPTVAELVGLDPMPDSDGISLVPLLAGSEMEVPPAVIETWHPWLTYGWAALEGIIDTSWKLVVAPTSELYDLSHDPGETVNVIGRHPEVDRRLRSLLIAASSGHSHIAATIEDPETAAALAALGYLSAGSSVRQPPTGLADPKDMRELARRIDAAELQLRGGHPDRAVAEYRAILAADPGNRLAVLRIGSILLQQDQPAAALPYLEKAVALDPYQAESRFALGDALVRTGALEASIRQWQECVRLQPRRASAWSNLGTVLSRLDRPADALGAYRRAAAEEPDDPLLKANLAMAELTAGNRATALELLERAAALDEAGFARADVLGLLLLEVGRTSEATTWLARSTPGSEFHPQARLALAGLEARAGRREEARALLAEALGARPDLAATVAADPLLAALVEPP